MVNVSGKQRQQSAHANNIVVDRKFEEGKLEVGFLKSNGQVGSKFELYHDIDHLVENSKQINYAATGYSLKKTIANISPPKKRLVSATAELKEAMRSGGGGGSGGGKEINIARADAEYDPRQMKQQLP